MSEQKKPSSYYLVLRDEDNGKTHICLHRKDDSQKTLELVEASELQAAQEKILQMEAHIKSTCGYIILADSEHFKTPLCYEHFSEYETLKSKHDSLLAMTEKLVGLIAWTRDGIQHFTHEDDQLQVEHLSKRITDALKEYEGALND